MRHISIIAAVSRDAVIGVGGTIPWRYPADMRFFKEYTMGKPIIMGRKTFDSLPGRKPLPGRVNIVLSRTPQELPEDVLGVSSFNDALIAAGDVPEVCIIGGANVYAQALPVASKMILTKVPVIVNLNGRLDKEAIYFPLTSRVDWQMHKITRLNKVLEVNEMWRVPGTSPFHKAAAALRAKPEDALPLGLASI